MKISQIFDKKIDQNQIESKYLWYRTEDYTKKAYFRINLSTFSVKPILEFSLSTNIWILMNLPNNQFFGVHDNRHCQSFFISDEKLNMKFVGNNIYENLPKVSVVACFYDDSVYTFQADLDLFNWEDKRIVNMCLKRYSFKNNSWINLTPPSHYPDSCIAINQKIIFVEKNRSDSIWIYDILIDSYTNYSPIRFDGKNAIQWVLKNAEKVYLFVFSGVNKIYYCDGPLSDWNLIYHLPNTLLTIYIIIDSCFLAYYEGSNYYVKNLKIYKFALENLEIREAGNIDGKKIWTNI